MKALSIRQPWVWLILFAGKDVENRTWRPPHALVGHRFLIHAAKGCTEEEIEEAEDFAGCYVPAMVDLDRGGIVGSARLLGWATRDPSPQGGLAYGASTVGYKRFHESRWFTGPTGFLLGDVRPLPFTPLRGFQRFFNVPDELVRKLGVQ